MRIVCYRLALAGGLGLLGYGVALIHVPAALILAGALVALGAFAGLGLDGSGR